MVWFGLVSASSLWMLDSNTRRDGPATSRSIPGSIAFRSVAKLLGTGMHMPDLVDPTYSLLIRIGIATRVDV